MSPATAALLVALAVLVAGEGTGARLARLAPSSARMPGRRAGGADDRRVALAGVAAVAVWALVGGGDGVVAGAAAAAAAWYAVGREATRAEHDRRSAMTRSLPQACDLMAACVAAGVPPLAALDEVADAVDGPLAETLRGVARGTRLGLSAADAWAPHTADGSAALRTLAAVLTRSAESGASPAAALDAISTDLRDQRRADGEAAARRAGVAMVAPLGACFLPAFVVVGVVPFVAGLVDGALLGGG